MIFGIGCDLCAISRMEKSLTGPHGAAFARRVFGPAERAALGTAMSQTILDDYGYFFASYLRMNFVMNNRVTGFTAHPSDYYEITAQLSVGE